MEDIKEVSCWSCEFMEHDHSRKETKYNPSGENFFCTKKLRKSTCDLFSEMNDDIKIECGEYKYSR